MTEEHLLTFLSNRLDPKFFYVSSIVSLHVKILVSTKLIVSKPKYCGTSNFEPNECLTFHFVEIKKSWNNLNCEFIIWTVWMRQTNFIQANDIWGMNSFHFWDDQKCLTCFMFFWWHGEVQITFFRYNTMSYNWEGFWFEIKMNPSFQSVLFAEFPLITCSYFNFVASFISMISPFKTTTGASQRAGITSCTNNISFNWFFSISLSKGCLICNCTWRFQCLSKIWTEFKNWIDSQVKIYMTDNCTGCQFKIKVK